MAETHANGAASTTGFLTLQQQQLQQVSHLLSELEKLDIDISSFPDKQLQAFCVRKAAPLNIDNSKAPSSEPLFFSPCQDSERLRALISEETVDLYWPKACRKKCQGPSTKDDPGLCHCSEEAAYRAEWCLGAIGSCGGAIQEFTSWYSAGSLCGMGLCTMGDCELDEHRLPFHSGRHVQQHYPQKSIYNNYNYKLCCAFRAGNYATGWKELGWTPRIGGCVWDATEASQGVVLRSELHSILFLLAHQLKHRRYLNHHTIPVLIFSFQHDRTARITQAHFSGDELILRQSRFLHMHADEPTDDAYLVARWMISFPVGETTDVPVEQRSREYGVLSSPIEA